MTLRNEIDDLIGGFEMMALMENNQPSDFTLGIENQLIFMQDIIKENGHPVYGFLHYRHEILQSNELKEMKSGRLLALDFVFGSVDIDAILEHLPSDEEVEYFQRKSMVNEWLLMQEPLAA